MSNSHTQSALPGNPIEKVSLNIDYEIIEHFSQHLYGSPNKAIEELVANGFDAFATMVYVFLPTQYTPEKVIVWDNGDSMDVEGLKGLWKIASSPKQLIPNRISSSVRRTNVPSRKIIGKFGIGKIASYTIGSTITHLCHIEDRYLLVQVDYTEVKRSLQSPTSGESNASGETSYQTPIRELTVQEARVFIEAQFDQFPPNFDEIFNEPAWTFAIISGLKRNDLTGGRLRWVLGNGMPLRPDFKIWVDLEEVTPKLARQGVANEWTFGSKEIQDNVIAEWKDAVDKGDVSGDITFSEQEGLDPSNPKQKVAFINLPQLGKAWGTIRLYTNSLEANRSTEYGRSSGFFIIVRGRLINQDDDKLFLSEPSFGTFYRSQFILYIDGLDEDLLADRERLRRETQRVKEFMVIQRSVYSVARSRQTALDNEAAKAASPTQRLPTYSREHFIEPLTALIVKQAVDDNPNLDVRNLAIERESLGDSGPMAMLYPDGSGFAVNTKHPYYTTLENLTGRGRIGRDVLREYELLAISEQLFAGFLYDIGLPDDKVTAIIEWRDEMYRILAQTSRSSIKQLALELQEASFKSGEIFENAIVAVLEAMGFKAERDGASGKKDVSMIAPSGDRSFRLTFEAKGKNKGPVPNDAAEISGAEAHRVSAKAEHAVVVARQFAGFAGQREESPAVLNECKAIGRVSIMQVDALIALLEVMNRYLYPLDMVKEVFTAIESPSDKLERIKRLNQPLKTFDYLSLLRWIWKDQGDRSRGRPVSYLTIFYDHYQDTITIEELEQKLNALYVMALPLISFDNSRREVALHQSPEKIVIRIQSALEHLEGGVS